MSVSGFEQVAGPCYFFAIRKSAASQFRMETLISADHQTEERPAEWDAVSEPGPPPRPVFARRVALKRKTTCADAFTAIFADCRRQIVTNRRLVLAGSDPEALHQLRVGLTRLRSALKAFRPLVGAVRADRLDFLARDMARGVGALRDADVLIEDIVARAADSTPTDALAMAALRGALVDHRAVKRREAVAALNGESWSALRLELGQWPEVAFNAGRGRVRSARRWSRHAMSKRWARVARLGKHIDTLSAEERHDLRKALKQLRYSTEFFSALFPREVRPFVKRLKSLQDVFGYLNDVELARRLEGIAAEVRAAGSDDCTWAAAFVLGWHTARAEVAWEEARAEWRRLSQGHKFWT